MAITKGEKMALWVSGAIVFAVVVWAFIMRKNAVSATTPNTDFDSPYYLNYNYPLVQYPASSASGLPTIPASDTTSDCGCTGGTNGFYTNLQQMLNSFQQGAENVFAQYQANVISALPTSEDQYFNNPAGASASLNAQNVLG